MIKITVCGNEIFRNEINCGVCGEENSTEMEIEFASGWNGYSKKIVFYDARGKNPVAVLLNDGNCIKDDNNETYRIRIPREPLSYVGMIEYVIDGIREDARKKSLAGEMRVRYAPDSNVEDVPSEVARTIAEQLQHQADRIENLANNVVPHIGENGNWFVYDEENGEFIDSEICARGPEGEKGEPGENGYSPVRGKDYWTPSDRKAISDEIPLPVLSVKQSHGEEEYNGRKCIAVTYDKPVMLPVSVRIEDILGKTIRLSGRVVNPQADNYAMIQYGIGFYDNILYASIYTNGIDESENEVDDEVRIPSEIPPGLNPENTVVVICLEATFENTYDESMVYFQDCRTECKGNGNWFIFDRTSGLFFDSGYNALGIKGDQGERGEKGDKGDKGERGEKGDKGNTGDTGYTPRRGTDYWTEEDIAEIKSYVEAAILGGEW